MPLQIRLFLLLLPLFLGGSLAAQGSGDATPSFAEWHAACLKLPKNRILGGRLPPQGLLPLKRFATLSAELDRFFSLSTNGAMAANLAWTGPEPTPQFWSVAGNRLAAPNPTFEPFVQKRLLPPGSKVLLQGDLHGDIHSLMAILGRLQESGFLNGFTLTNPSFHMAFLGDYTDRGVYGVEVIYTLLRLATANPGRILLVRGNHEDVALVLRYGFLAEGRGKYGPDFDAAKVLRAYDFLPVALYLGSSTDFVQMCHGGMEPGFDPRSLLNSSGTNRFQLLGDLHQTELVKSHPNWLLTDPISASAAGGLLHNFRPTAPTTPFVIGFMWNDFTVFGAEPAFADNPGRAAVYGQPAVAHLLKTQSSSTAKIQAVIRAHQHAAAPNPLMRRLIASRGIFRHWQEAKISEDPSIAAGSIETGLARPLPEGSVWTLNVSPDSVYGQGNGFNFATVILLEIGPTFADWRLKIDTVEIPGR